MFENSENLRSFFRILASIAIAFFPILGIFKSFPRIGVTSYAIVFSWYEIVVVDLKLLEEPKNANFSKFQRISSNITLCPRYVAEILKIFSIFNKFLELI